MNTAWMWIAWGAMAGFVGVYGWVWAKAGERGRKWLEWGLAALVAGVSAASVAMHEPWADELHTWLQARNLSVGKLWQEMACEGHFLPWHLILHLFAGRGAPVETMGWISWAINAVTVAWFVREAPLGGWAKAAVSLSCVFLYVNPVVSRCYVLVPPVLFGLAALWENRDEHPVTFGVLVALLANTHVCMEGTAGLVFLVYAWENVFLREDGKGWRKCGKQWAGLGVMAVGGSLAAAQVLPSLWESSVQPGGGPFCWKENATWFFRGCHSPAGIVAVAAGLAWLGREVWRTHKGVFWVYAGSLAYMAGFSVFVYPAHVANRALLWWPIALWAAWVAVGKGRRELGMSVAVAAVGLGLMRPDMTWRDWREEYDTLQGACRYITERYGRDAEVWISGSDIVAEGAAAYLDNLWDWRTGERATLRSLSAKAQRQMPPFETCRERIFVEHPENDSFLLLGSLTAEGGLSGETFENSRLEYVQRQCVGAYGAPMLVIRVGHKSSF